MSKKGFILFLLLISIAGYAQQDTMSGKNLDQVIVTANKFLQKQSTTGKVTTVINRELIEKSNGKSVAQLLNEQTGITINGAYNNAGTNQTVYMRGAASGRSLILIDGVPVNDVSTIDNSFDLNLISLAGVERIEIARGAQSTMYGSDAEAGVINIITLKKDVAKPINVKAGMSAGKFNTYKGNIQLYGKLKKLNYSLGYNHLQTKGFSSAYDSTGLKNFDNDGYKGNAANATLSYAATSELSFRVFGQYSKYKTDLDFGQFKDEKDFNNTNKMLMGGASFTYNKNAVSINGKYQYYQTDRDYFNDSIDDPSFFGFSTNTFFAKSQFADLYSNIELSKNFTLLQGVDYRINSMNSQYYSPFFSASFADTSLSQSSGYSSLFFRDNKGKLNIEVGGRLNVHSRYGSNGTYTFNPSYSINKNYRVFGSIASAFKAPTLFQLYDGFNGNNGLLPEKSKTVEIGVQQNYKMFATRFVYFTREIKDGIDFDNVNTYKYFNFNKQTVKGLEAEVEVKLPLGLGLTANYTFLQPKETSQSRITFKDTTYDVLLRRPKHNANVTVSYTHKNNLFVSVSAKYVGKRVDAGGYAVADKMLNSYFIINAYTEYKPLTFLKIFADFQNLSNKQFFDARGYNSIPFVINGGLMFNW